MKRSIPIISSIVVLCALGSLSGPAFAEVPSRAPTSETAHYHPSHASEWLDVIQEFTADEVDRNGPRPTVVSRTMAMAIMAMYDAWAAYDEKAVGTALGGRLRRPVAERTEANRLQAISQAVCRVLVDVYPADKERILAECTKRGAKPADPSTDAATAVGVGNLAASAVLAARHHDGANQLGTEAGSSGQPYADYTYYAPVNTPTEIKNPDRWQAITFTDAHGGQKTPGFLTPHWYRVKPFGLESAAQFRPGPPPLVGSAQLKAEVDECLKFNAELTPQTRAIVEFMRDGPRSTGQSGHWLKFAQLVSKRDHHTLEQDVKIYLAVAVTAMDAFIASWEAKRYYDSSRPWTLVHHYYKGQEIKGWAGPGKGIASLQGEKWHPYSPASFVTPPFPGYVSGHSCVSAGCAKTLELFTGSDHFGQKEVRPCCQLTEPTPGESVTLDLPTFTATAEMAGLSRVIGGYHIQADNVAGLKLGRDVAAAIWPKIKAYFDGTAPAH
jgi:PAP2 superfamily